MNAVSSSVLIISKRPPTNIGDADFISSCKEAKPKIKNHSVFLIDLTSDSQLAIEDFLQFLAKEKQNSATILLTAEEQKFQDLTAFINRFSISKLIPAKEVEKISQSIHEALHEVRNKEQHSELLKLLKAKNEQLKSLYSELEERVQKRQKELTQSRMKLLMTSHKETTLQTALLSIYQARSIGEMESRLLETLKASFKIELVRVLFEGQNQVLQNRERLAATFAFLETPLYLHNDPIGSLFFMRDREHPFTKGEQDFLQKIAEAVALALDRLETLVKSEHINLQWEATFSAISDPVVIVDDQYNVISSNFSRKGVQGKCYEVLFQRSAPCENCREASRFKVRDKDGVKTFEVSSQAVPFVTEKRKTFVHLYRDITERLQMEKQILESSKLAELGTIGSSIAHELNNPIGGILTFAQLLKMDLAEDDPLREDIVSIEDGARRCKEIVQNLLSFTRNPEVDSIEELDLRDVVHRALKILELKTRAKGIHVLVDLPSQAVTFKGHFNLLSQALQNTLQNSFEAITEKMRNHKGFHGQIKVSLQQDAQGEIKIAVEDNGLGMSEATLKQAKDLMFTTKDANFNPGLGLAIADRIIKDHQGQLDLDSVQYEKTTVLMHFPRPVLS